MIDETPDETPDETDLTAADLVRKGMAKLQRNIEDGVGEEPLVEYVANRLPDPDIAAIKRRRASDAVRGLRNHGVTEADGQLTFPGIDPYDYEPDRLVLSDDGTIVEQHRAKPKAKAAESTRTMRKAQQALEQARRRQVEDAAFSQWALERIRAGADYANDISFGAFVTARREAGD